MTRDLTVSFKLIPKSSALLLDYLYDFSKVSRFFAHAYALDSFRKESVTCSPQLAHRDELCQILETQNRAFGASPRTFENLERLRDGDCWAVVTGQQVGLFGGPAYTIYKALTAVKLAAHYACRGMKVVPIFWMATEDHDLAEVDHTYLVDGDSHARLIRYEGRPDDASRPVGCVAFSEAIHGILRDFLDLLPESEFRRETADQLRNFYRPGQTFSSSFGRLFSFLFSNYGLVLLDPQDRKLKMLAKPAFERILRESPRYRELLHSRSDQLMAAGYHAQVVVDKESTGLFFEEDGRRRALIREGDILETKGGSQATQASWLERIRDTPWMFSPNVLFRPVIQDLLLPTFSYVAGPSEIAYLAQIGPLYGEFERRAPIVFPRFSFSILDRKIVKIMEKHRLEFTRFFANSDAIIKWIVEENLDRSLASQFQELEEMVGEQLGRLDAPLRVIDATLGEALKTTQQKVLYQINHLRAKFVSAEARHQEVLTKQVDKALGMIYPMKALQERRINIFYFLARYGMDFLAQLYEEIDLTNPDHKLFYVS